MSTQLKGRNLKSTQEKTAKDSQMNVPFVSKLNKMLQDKDCCDYIKWSTDGSMFNILNIRDFADKVLPRYFKHGNYSSFVRLLNMYGFHKMKSGEDAEVTFCHEKFRRDGKKLSKIKRATLKRDSSDDEDDDDYVEKSVRAHRPKWTAPTTEMSAFKDQITEIADKFRTLEDKAFGLKEMVSQQNDTIKYLLAELVQIRKDEDKNLHNMLSQILADRSEASLNYHQNEFDKPTASHRLDGVLPTNDSANPDYYQNPIMERSDDHSNYYQTNTHANTSADFTENQVEYGKFTSHFIDTEVDLVNQTPQNAFLHPSQSTREVPYGIIEKQSFVTSMDKNSAQFERFVEDSRLSEDHLGSLPYKKLHQRELVQFQQNYLFS